MAPIETEYYDLVRSFHSKDANHRLPVPSQLGVGTDVEDTDLKKAYRKQAMKVIKLPYLSIPACPNIPNSITPTKTHLQMQRSGSRT